MAEEDKKETETAGESTKGRSENKDDEEGAKGHAIWWTIGIIVILALVAYYVFNTGGGITGSAIFGGGSEMVTLGFMGPLSGEAASYGQSARRGVELALEDSGLADRVEVVYEDSQCEGKEAVNAINKLISVDGAVAVIGEMCSGATIPVAPIAEENGVVLISPASTSPEITNLGDYVFRTIPSDSLQGDFASDLIFNRGYRRLAILYSQEDYGVGLSTVLTEEFEAAGGEVVASEAFERGSTDLRTQIAKIKDADADVIYFISNSPDAVVAGLRQIREQGLLAVLFGSEGLRSPDTLEAGNAAQGLTVTSVTAGTQEFVQKHIDRYAEEPGPFAAQAYDAFMALAETIENGAMTGKEIKDALYGVEFDGASGHIKFDSNGDVTGNYDIFIVNQGEFVHAN